MKSRMNRRMGAGMGARMGGEMGCREWVLVKWVNRVMFFFFFCSCAGLFTIGKQIKK